MADDASTPEDDPEATAADDAERRDADSRGEDEPTAESPERSDAEGPPTETPATGEADDGDAADRRTARATAAAGGGAGSDEDAAVTGRESTRDDGDEAAGPVADEPREEAAGAAGDLSSGGGGSEPVPSAVDVDERDDPRTPDAGREGARPAPGADGEDDRPAGEAAREDDRPAADTDGADDRPAGDADESVDDADESTGDAGDAPTPAVPEDVRKYDRFQKMDGAQYDRVNEFLRERTYVTAREWAIARLCADFRTETGVEMTKIGENLPELVPFMTDTYTPQAVNQARASFERKVTKAGATFLYGAMCDFFTADELDDLMYEVTEVAKFLLEVEGVDLSVEEELESEDRISSVMREVRRSSDELRHDGMECPNCGHEVGSE